MANESVELKVDESIAVELNGDAIIVAALMICLSTAGIIANILVICTFLHAGKLRNQFTLLCVSSACADSCELAVFLFWAVPMTVTKSTLSTGFAGKKLGQISLLFWFTSLYCTLAIAVNRFLAIVSPMSYKRIFSSRNTVGVICVCWLLGCLHEIVYVFDGCDFYYDNEAFIWMYSTSYCGQMVGWILDLGYGVLFFVLVFVLNTMTFWKIRTLKSIATRETAAATAGLQTQRNQERRRRDEVRFFYLSCIHAGVFELMLLSFHVFSRLTADKWGSFFTTTCIWQFSHAFNGFIYILFNQEVRQKIRTMFRIRPRDNTVHSAVDPTSKADSTTGPPKRQVTWVR